VLLVVGGVSTVNNIAASWAAGVMLLLWSIAYQFTVSATVQYTRCRVRTETSSTQVGTVCFSLTTELSSRRLLIKTLNLGRGLYCVIGM
jgi:SP family general alpha glucoside:H+ symporter-like MFS transporter